MIDLLVPVKMIEAIFRRGVGRAVSNGIRQGVADGFQDALGLKLDVEPSELPALEAEPAPNNPTRKAVAKKTPAKSRRVAK
jgi:hypothetical protein